MSEMVAQALHDGKDPAEIPLFRQFPQDYGFRVFDHRALASRHVLSAMNTRWLPVVEKPPTAASYPDRAAERTATGTDLLEGFTDAKPAELRGHAQNTVSLLIRRVGISGDHYWVQTYMVGDPAMASVPVIINYLADRVLVPILFFIPALTLAMFLTTRSALRPLRRLSDRANLIGAAVARGQALTRVPEQGMAREFADVAITINSVLAKLDRSLKLQKQFASDVAHELRTPLAVLLLEISRLSASPAHEQIKTDLKELGHLVDELLRFAQAEDVMSTDAGEVDVAIVARKVSEEAVIEAIAKRQRIEFDCVASATTLKGSSALLEIAIRNLVYNALKYSPSNTAVTVRIEQGPLVVVEDCGPGIPSEHRERVFERFWRAEGHIANGAGVGLALVRRIAQLHDGSVQLEDRPGGGARMILSLVGAAPSQVHRKGSALLGLATQ